ncbi:MAG: peptidylprolyl isomerase [Syntrophothermus sp.]
MTFLLRSAVSAIIASLLLLQNSFCRVGPGNDTLALINDTPVTSQTFARLYAEKIGRLGLTDNGDVRQKYLLNLVSDEVLIQKAKFDGMDRTPDAIKELDRLKLQELLNSWSKKHISPQINIPDEELKDLFVKFNTSIKVSHLYAPSRAEADKLYNQLSKGKDFNSLAREIFSDPELRDNGGSLGYISVDQMDPEFEKAAYSMKKGEISHPVKTVEGYSIIRIDEIKKNPLVTETEFLKAKERLKAFVRKRAYEEAVLRFTGNLRKDLKIKFNPTLLIKFYDALKDSNAVPFSEQSKWISAGSIKGIIVTSVLGQMNGRILAGEISSAAEGQKKWIRSRENLEDFIAGLIMRRFIARSAKLEKLDTLASFSANVKYAFDSYLLKTKEQQLRQQIKISPDSAKAFYSSHPEIFIKESEVRLSSILLEDKKTADSVKTLLFKGEKFEYLAEKFSTQRNTSYRGGDIGWFSRKMLGNIAGEVFALKQGEWTGPLEEDGKYALLKCTDIKPPIMKSFDEAKKEIEESLANMSWLSFRQKYTDSLKTEISVKIFPEKLNALKI